MGVTAAQDLFEIAPADDKPVEILGIELGQTSDSGDAADEQPAADVRAGTLPRAAGARLPRRAR